jgi:hypothetical protein
MTFSSVNYVAILIAAVAGWLAGAAWYMVLGKLWTAALGITPEMKQAQMQQPGAFLPFIYAFAAEVIMAWALAGLLFHISGSQTSVRAGVISGALCWLCLHHHVGQLQLRPARHAPAVDRQRPLAGRAGADGRHFGRNGRPLKPSPA